MKHLTDGGRRQTRWSTEVSYTHESCVSRRYSSLPEYRSAAMAHTDESTDPATKSIPDETIMSPKPVSGETSPPAANPKAPSKAEAAPACSLPASEAHRRAQQHGDCGHSDAACQERLFHCTELQGKGGCGSYRECIGTETYTEHHRGEPVVFLHDERR